MYSYPPPEIIDGAVVYPPTSYYKNVAIRPVWASDDDHSLGVRVLLFSDVFVTTIEQKTSNEPGLGRIKVISRSMEQAARHIPDNEGDLVEGADNSQLFEWLLPWSPIKGRAAIASHPSGVPGLPFTTISSELPCRVSTDVLKVKFRLMPVNDESSFVIKKGTPIVDLRFI